MPDVIITPRSSPPNNAPSIGPMLLLVDSVEVHNVNIRGFYCKDFILISI